MIKVIKKIHKRKCKYCGKTFLQYNTLQTKCNQCTFQDLYQKKPTSKFFIVKPKKPRIKSDNKKWKEKAWSIFSKYIRLRDCLLTTGTPFRGKCYTCGKEFDYKKLQAGHGISGRGNNLLLDEEIVKAQCIRCNIQLGGNYEVFVSNLIAENNLKWYQDKLKLKKIPTKKNWEEEYKKFKKKYDELFYSKDLPF